MALIQHEPDRLAVVCVMAAYLLLFQVQSFSTMVTHEFFSPCPHFTLPPYLKKCGPFCHNTPRLSSPFKATLLRPPGPPSCTPVPSVPPGLRASGGRGLGRTLGCSRAAEDPRYSLALGEDSCPAAAGLYRRCSGGNPIFPLTGQSARL